LIKSEPQALKRGARSGLAAGLEVVPFPVVLLIRYAKPP